MEMEIIQQEIRDVLAHMGFDRSIESIETHEGAANRLSVRVHNEANMLIGERGNNLVSLEHIVKKLVQKKYPEGAKFTLDINDYRMRQLEDLKQDVKSAAKEVRLYQKQVPLRSMSSFERRIVHLLLAEYPDITTESIGQEPERRVIIKPFP